MRLAVLVIGLISFGVVQANEMEAWLQKMMQATTTTNYEGTLIIRQNDQMQAMRIRHGAETQGMWESLESLTGEVRKVVRENGKVTTVYPQRNLITISRDLDPQTIHYRLPSDVSLLKQHYHLKLAGKDRIASQPAQVIDVLPKDHFRYGFKFWLAEDSGLLLRCDLVDERGKIVEQLMFSDLTIMDSAPEKIKVMTDEAKQYRLLDLDAGKRQQSGLAWVTRHLPAGFSLTRNDVKPSIHGKGMVQHIVFSDGMASVSVFIERHHPDETALMGVSRMGAVNAYSFHLDDDHVTVIGEVPVATVRFIGQAIHKQSHND